LGLSSLAAHEQDDDSMMSSSATVTGAVTSGTAAYAGRVG
jgi:hypothetical protein